MSRLALDYVSPLPPVRSGISDYSTDLLPFLEPLCDLRVVRLPGQPVDAEVAARWSPVESDRLGEGGRLPLYHMGNNQYHLDVYHLAMQRPGVVTLHDLVLHHFLLGSTVGHGFQEFERYRRRLGMEHGWVGDVAATGVRWGTIGNSVQFSLPANQRLVSRQRGILVHSRWAREMLLEENPDLAVRTVPMGIPLPDRVDEGRGKAFRRRQGIPQAAPLLGSFGFQTPMKRTEVIVRALRQPELHDVHLVIAGAVAPTLELDQLIARGGVGDRVHVTGFLSQDDFAASIAACDLALNLRYPSAGETSAALLRVLALGRPTIVSEYAQFAELPDEAAIKIPVGNGEMRSLVEEVARLLEDDECRLAMGEAARDFVRREHDPAGAGKAVVEACQELVALQPVGEKPPVNRPTSLTWSRLPGSIEVRGAEAPWPEGERRRLEVCLTNRSEARWLDGHQDPGGVVVEATFTDSESLPAGAPVLEPLPVELAPGESALVGLTLRRPLGPVELRIESRVLGGADVGGEPDMRWEGRL